MSLSLDRYRLLGRSALRVSPLCLGTMTFGPEWGWGADKEESRRLLDLYLERGGNFIDTANKYTEGTSEAYLGEFLEGRRDRVVLATKYTLNMRRGDPNAGGNHRKNMVQSLEASLKRLRTDYVDLYWVHIWDEATGVEETMRALDDLVRAGKVLHVGVSDYPAWLVARANTLAELRGWTAFTALQVEYSLIERGVERELLPMAIDLGIAVTPWGPLGGGMLTGKYVREDSDSRRKDTGMNDHRVNDRNLAIADRVVSVASDLGRSPAQVSLAWLLGRPGVTSPILGARSVPQLEDNLGCLDLALPAEAVRDLDEASAIDLGWPRVFMARPQIQDIVRGGTVLDG